MKIKKLAALISAAALLISGCSNLSEKKDLTYTDTLFDTVISVQILDPVDKSVIEGCEKLCKEYDAKFSKTNKDSEIQGVYSLAEDRVIEINDGTNILKIRNGTADMAKANCPDKLCVNQRAISKNGESIICLPNEVVVTVDSSENSEFDAVAQ